MTEQQLVPGTVDFNKMRFRHRVLCRFWQAMILAFWYDEDKVERYAAHLQQHIEWGTLHK